MSILIHQNTKIITQGATGRVGRLYTEKCINYGHGAFSFVAGVNPKKAGETVLNMPIYASVKEAKEKTAATVSIIYVPPVAAVEAIWEAVQADIDLVVCATVGIPAKDLLQLHHKMAQRKALGKKTVQLLGPGSPGILQPEVLKVGMIPDYECKKGRIGVIVESGTLAYEVVAQLAERGLAPSTIIGLGRERMCGVSVVDALQMFEKDSGTDAVVLVLESNCANTMEPAYWYRCGMQKPVVVYMPKYVHSFTQRFPKREKGILQETENSKALFSACRFLHAETFLDISKLVEDSL